MTYPEFDKRIDELRTLLMLNNELAYFSQVLLMCRLIPDPSIPTACINGIVLKINPDWFMNLEPHDPKEQVRHQLFVLVHEALHPALQDIVRKGDKDHGKWNQACDYYNNAYIKHTLKNVDYPKNAPYLYNADYVDMDKEEIYDLLLSQPDKSNPLEGDLGEGSGDNDEGDSDGDNQEAIDQVKQVIQQAAITATQMGYGNSVPDGIKRYLDELYNPKLPWNKILVNHMQAMLNKDDYSYSKPNMHYLHQGFYVPSLYSESVGHIITAHDESGSVSDKDVQLYLGAIHDMWDTCKPSELTVLGFTTKITSEFNFVAGQSLDEINFRGCGGTDVHPVFDYCEDKHPEALIIFTDMDFKYPTKIPDYPVIWINTGRPSAEAPFGTIIHV